MTPQTLAKLESNVRSCKEQLYEINKLECAIAALEDNGTLRVYIGLPNRSEQFGLGVEIAHSNEIRAVRNVLLAKMRERLDSTTREFSQRVVDAEEVNPHLVT
jgi:hypothetical protein